MPGIYEGTNFKIASRTSDYIKYKSKDIQMLDWDFRRWEKNPEKIEKLHLDITKEYEIETVMSMDLWDYNVKEALEYANELKKHANRVLIPAHHYCKELLEYDLAYPNANWFSSSDPFPTYEYRKRIKHILGGSPQSQIRYLITTQRDLEGKPLRFPNVESIDGNQLFNTAIRVGKEWFPNKPHWRNLGNNIPNEQKFRNSVIKFDKYIKEVIPCILNS